MRVSGKRAVAALLAAMATASATLAETLRKTGPRDQGRRAPGPICQVALSEFLAQAAPGHAEPRNHRCRASG